MARIEWSAAGARVFETGVDRGVLYLPNRSGVSWDGLVSVAEFPVGGKVSSYYLDGIKYFDHTVNDEFQAVIEAYTYPEEFAECDGTQEVDNGLFVTEQAKKSFGFSYRTMVGNDVNGLDLGYKIHLVYNATAEPTERLRSTITDVVEPNNFSWRIFTKAPTFSGKRPTSHFVVDSRKTSTELLQTIQDILYGTPEQEPRLPSVTELLFIFQEYQASVFDAGYLVDEYFNEFDAGVIPEPYTSTIDGGGP